MRSLFRIPANRSAAPAVDAMPREYERHTVDTMPILRNPQHAGRYITVDGSQQIAFTAGTKLELQHGLGRAYQGWRIERAIMGEPLLYEDTSAAGTSLVLALYPVADCTVEIWVY